MRDKENQYTTLKVKIKTKKELLKMQALYQLDTGEKTTIDQIVWTFIENQPKAKKNDFSDGSVVIKR